jgi:hypothetical protein
MAPCGDAGAAAWARKAPTPIAKPLSKTLVVNLLRMLGFRFECFPGGPCYSGLDPDMAVRLKVTFFRFTGFCRRFLHAKLHESTAKERRLGGAILLLHSAPQARAFLGERVMQTSMPPPLSGLQLQWVLRQANDPVGVELCPYVGFARGPSDLNAVDHGLRSEAEVEA